MSLAGAIVGALPWIWANLGSSFASLHAVAGERVTLGNPWFIFFHYGLPMLLGLRAPITLGWQIPYARVIYVAFLGLVAVLVVLRPRPLRLVLFATIVAPAVFALLPSTYYFGEPRYLTFLWPLLAIIIGWGIIQLRRFPLEAAAVLAVIGLTTLGVGRMTEPGQPRARVGV